MTKTTVSAKPKRHQTKPRTARAKKIPPTSMPVKSGSIALSSGEYQVKCQDREREDRKPEQTPCANFQGNNDPQQIIYRVETNWQPTAETALTFACMIISLINPFTHDSPYDPLHT